MRRNNNDTRLLTLKQEIYQIDPIQGRRFEKLQGNLLQIATEGIIRHLKACRKMDVNPEPQAIREIIEDAASGRRIYAITNEDVLFNSN